MNRAPLDSDRSTSWRLAMARTCFGAFVAALLCVACHDWLTVPPLNDPTPGDVGKNPLAGLQLTAKGILFQNRASPPAGSRSEEHTSELQSQSNLVCRLLLEKKKKYYVT